MITVSSNLATNLLMREARRGEHPRRRARLGADGMHVLRGLEDGKAFARGMNNTTTARALRRSWRRSPRGGPWMRIPRAHVAVLERQTFNDHIPAGLPPGTRVAHKTGEITRIQHDAAIVYAPRPFVLVVLTRGLADPKESAALMAEITRRLYEASQRH